MSDDPLGGGGSIWARQQDAIERLVERLLEELHAQVEVNKRLARELVDVRLRFAEYKLQHPRPERITTH